MMAQSEINLGVSTFSYPLWSSIDNKGNELSMNKDLSLEEVITSLGNPPSWKEGHYVLKPMLFCEGVIEAI